MNKRSWRALITGQMAIALVCMIMSVFWMVNNYNAQIRQTYQRENQRAAATWCSLTTTRLSSSRNHLYEVMLQIYTNNAELSPGTPVIDFGLRRKLLTSMTDKQATSNDLTFLYIKDTESDMLLFSAVNVRPAVEIYNVKSWVRAENMQLTTTGNRQWDIVSIGEYSYFSKAFSLGRYIVGGLSDLTLYGSAQDMHILGNAFSMSLQRGEDTFFVGGDRQDDFSAKRAWTVSAPLERTDAQLVLTVQQDSLGNLMSASVLFLIFAGILEIGLLVVLMLQMKRSISDPTKVLLKATHKIQGGDLNYRIEEEADSTEFDTLYHSFNAMVEQIQNLRIESYDQRIRQKQDELSMMRAQLRPHFYLNAITTVSNMTYQDRDEDIREYLKALAKYMRYMMNYQERTSPLHVELEHIQSYLQMQKIRFPDSVDAFVGCSSQVKDVEIPVFLVFTVVENAFKHAMSLYAPLKMLILCESFQTENFHGCRIMVEDNGKGFSQEVLETYRPGNGIPEAKDHIGLSNVSRTLQLTYHREDLLRLSNAPSGGARVEIMIPEEEVPTIKEEDHEAADL